MKTIAKADLDYLKKLEKNNNRTWFQEHKDEFEYVKSNFKEFVEQTFEMLNEHDEIEDYKIFRIYRDVRFSKNKAPYKTNLGASFQRLGAERRGGYYLHLQPVGSFSGTGFWAPSKEDLFRIRKEFEQDSSEMREVLENPSLKKYWGELKGERLKTAPRGFSKEDPNLDLIQHKQLVFVRDFTDKEVLSKNFANQLDEGYRAIRPFFDLMSSILTTDLNGESIL